MIGIQAMPARSATVSSRGKTTLARGIGEDVKQTIKPRVNELRRNQLAVGTTDFGSTHLIAFYHSCLCHGAENLKQTVISL